MLPTTYHAGEFQVTVTPGHSHSSAWRAMWRHALKADAKAKVAA